MARHHSFTSSQSEIKSTPTLPSHHPPPPSRSQPPHPRRPPPAVRVGCSEARASKQARSSAAGVWASTVAQRAAALDSLWQLRRAAAVYSTESSCGNCRRDNRFPNSDARCALVPADTVLPEKACVHCFARINRAFNSTVESLIQAKMYSCGWSTILHFTRRSTKAQRQGKSWPLNIRLS